MNFRMPIKGNITCYLECKILQEELSTDEEGHFVDVQIISRRLVDSSVKKQFKYVLNFCKEFNKIKPNDVITLYRNYDGHWVYFPTSKMKCLMPIELETE